MRVADPPQFVPTLCVETTTCNQEPSDEQPIG
jgi:hypothetical protein